MQASSRQMIQSTFEASDQGRIHFGQVVAQLLAADVQGYHVDYRAGRATYYLAAGGTMDLAFEPAGSGIATVFDAEAIRAAVRGAQQGTVMYPQFKRLSQHGGCAGYMVWLTGRHVSYYGRSGETHIERFPD